MTTQDTAHTAIPDGLGQGPFSIAMLQLCQISYKPRKQIPGLIANMKPLAPGGVWFCIWGPAEDYELANLAFIAGYSPGPSQPMFAAVVIRGTDLTIMEPVAAAMQLWEDLDAADPGPLPWTPNYPAALIAGGTSDTLEIIQGMVSANMTLNIALTNFLAGPGKGSFVAVTGHSLGGCAATVVAPWLRTALTSYTGAMIPVTFAAPTAGNPAFASYFNQMFPYSLRYQNPLDVIPLAFEDLSGMEDIYLNWGLELPPEFYGFIWCAELALIDTTYAQPASNAPPLGQDWLVTNSWTDEALFQHHTSTYMTLLKGTNFGTLLASERRTRKGPSLRQRLGPLRERVQKMRAAAAR